jgi:hypothetical protein
MNRHVGMYSLTSEYACVDENACMHNINMAHIHVYNTMHTHIHCLGHR